MLLWASLLWFVLDISEAKIQLSVIYGFTQVWDLEVKIVNTWASGEQQIQVHERSLSITTKGK